jgi:hypothetical protein
MSQKSHKCKICDMYFEATSETARRRVFVPQWDSFGSSHNFSFDIPRRPTEHTFVPAYLARACIKWFRSAWADYRAGTVAAVFGVRATPLRAATGITSFTDRMKIAADIQPSARRDIDARSNTDVKVASRLVSRHGSHLAVGMGSVWVKVLVGTLGDRLPILAADLPCSVVCRCHVREVRSLPRRRAVRRSPRDAAAGFWPCQDPTFRALTPRRRSPARKYRPDLTVWP